MPLETRSSAFSGMHIYFGYFTIYIYIYPEVSGWNSRTIYPITEHSICIPNGNAFYRLCHIQFMERKTHSSLLRAFNYQNLHEILLFSILVWGKRNGYTLYIHTTKNKTTKKKPSMPLASPRANITIENSDEIVLFLVFSHTTFCQTTEHDNFIQCYSSIQFIRYHSTFIRTILCIENASTTQFVRCIVLTYWIRTLNT